MSVKIAVVTGTAKPHGIGRAIARSLVSSLNYKVLGVDSLDAESLDREDPEFRTQYAHYICDVSAEQVSKIWSAAKNKFGGDSSSLELACIVNNAAIADPSMPMGESNARLSRWKSVIDVNLTGPFLVCEALLPHMSTQLPFLPSIINIASTRALMSEPNTEAYTAAKAGLLGLTHALSQSLAGKVRVNAILPGWIDTSVDDGNNVSITEEDRKFHPAGRVGTPEDVAEMCVFLAGEKAGFITGQEFVVDGGVTKKMIYPE